jgi:hypothetical protein
MFMRTWNWLRIIEGAGGGVSPSVTHNRNASKLLKLGLAIIACFALAIPAQAIIAYGTPATVPPGWTTAGDANLGLEFTVNSGPGIMLTEMGAFDLGGDGFGGTVQVAIYDTSSQNQVPGTLASFSGTSQTLVGLQRWNDIADVYLAPGTYMVVAHYSTSDRFEDKGQTTFGGSPYLTEGSYWGDLSATSLAYPTTGQSFRYGAGTFDFSPVPEAAHFAMAAVGVLGLVYIGRYARLRRKINLA